MATQEPDIPTGCYEQPEKTLVNAGGAKTITRKFRGPHSSLVTFANGYSIGNTEHDGLPLQSVRLAREVGDPNLGTLDLTFAKPNQDQGGSNTATVIGVTWQLRHTQKMVSVYRYCGDSQGASANRGRIEQWRKGTDAYLYQNFQWRDKVGAVHTLTGRDQMLAAKFRAGFETVMRFYPTITKTTIYTHGKIEGVGDGLAHINSKATMGAPSGWGDSAAAWLKVGDDLSYDSSTGKQTRTEAWLGEESFDANFYGEENSQNPDAGRWEWGSI
jgi:hypothetical protein